MQVFVTATLLPTVAETLGGRAWYAAAIAAGTATVFVTMPVAGPLLDRIGAGKLLALLAPVYVAGAVLSAVAPAMWVYVLGRGVQGLASGGLSTLALGAVGGLLPAAWRARVFALTAAMWVVPALIGPAYAAAVAGLAGWRIAYASLVPLLLLAQVGLARALPNTPDEDDATGAGRALGVPAAIALAACMAVVAVGARGGALGALAAVLGAAGALVVGRRLLLPGTYTLRPGRPAAVGALALLGAAFFSTYAVVTVVAREVFGVSRLEGGLTLSIGAVAWGVASIARSRAARTDPAATFAPGAAILAAGTGAMAVAAAVGSLPLLWLGFAAAGCGMGLAYPALLETAFAREDDDDTGPGTTAGSAVLAEALGSSLGAVLAGAVVTAAIHHATRTDAILAVLYAVTALLALGLLVAAPRLRTE
jgi:MFS family permease